MSVYYNVPLIPQDSSLTCWYACARMIVRFHRDRVQATTLAGGEVGQPGVDAQMSRMNRALNPDLAVGVARAMNMQMVWLSPTPGALENLLASHGPLWYGGNVRGYRDVQSGAHCVVLTGIRRDAPGDEVLINDPWPSGMGGGAQLAMEYSDFFSKLQAVPGVPMLHI